MYEVMSVECNLLDSCEPLNNVPAEDRLVSENALLLGIRENQFELYYQPQVNSKRQVLGAEALLRWNHPSQQLVMPAEFIPLAEQTGLIIKLGEHVLVRACSQLRAWATMPSTSHLTLSVNISARQLQQDNFVEQVLSIIDNQDANPERLNLELTESILLQDIKSVIAKMKRLKDYGLRFALDDFGTGYSSLSYLSRLPLDQIKIDQSFVRNVGSKKHDAIIIEALIGLGQRLGLCVVAEGIETSSQLDYLSQHGCTSYQGYLFGRAVPVEEFQC